MSLYGINSSRLDGRKCAPPGYYESNISENFEMYYYRRPDLNREGIFVFSNCTDDIDYDSLFAFHPNVFILMHYIRQTDTFRMYIPSIEDKITCFYGNSEIYSDVVRRFFQELDITDASCAYDTNKESKEDTSMGTCNEFVENNISRLPNATITIDGSTLEMYKNMLNNLLSVAYKSSTDYQPLITNLRFNITVIKKIVDDIVIDESDDTEAKSKVSTIRFNTVGELARYMKSLIDLLYNIIKEV